MSTVAAATRIDAKAAMARQPRAAMHAAKPRNGVVRQRGRATLVMAKAEKMEFLSSEGAPLDRHAVWSPGCVQDACRTTPRQARAASTWWVIATATSMRCSPDMIPPQSGCRD
jgi:hypothetical protein